MDGVVDAGADADSLRDGPAVDGPTPLVDDALARGVDVAVGPGDADELDPPPDAPDDELADALPLAGEVVGGALLGCELGPDAGPPTPRRVTTAPLGANVTVLVHDPDGAALVTVATIA